MEYVPNVPLKREMVRCSVVPNPPYSDSMVQGTQLCPLH